MKKKENLIFNQDRVEISERIEAGKTIFYNCKKEAQTFANSIRSYVYDAFNDKGVLIGFCVPK